MRLNSQQSEIVTLPRESSILVLAGAGSGKTTVIAHRAISIAQQLKEGEHLQMLTFSNKAAKEMKARVKRVNGVIHPSIRFDTFHSYGLKLIKSDPVGFGLTADFSLLGDSDVKRLLRTLATEAGVPKKIDPADKKRLNPVNWLSTWSLKRQAGYDVRNPNNKTVLCDALRAAHKLSDSEVTIAWQTLSGYEGTKQNTNSLDFDDLLFLPLLRISRDQAFLQDVRSGLGAAVVDESQDTNRVQYELVARISNGYVGVTMVGDDDQSIYGWRGAEVSNLRRFKKQFNAVELRLEQNYRSTQSIVNTAKTLIEHNETRLPKDPFSEGSLGEDPLLHGFPTSWDMVNHIASGIKHRLDNGAPAEEIAVLYRTNRMAMLLEPALRKAGIPYHVVGGMSLFDRAEVVAITNAVRLARNARDSHALKSLTPYIDRFGEASSYAVCDWLETTPGSSLYELPPELPEVSKGRMLPLINFMSDLQSEALLSHTAADFVKWAVDGPMALLDREKDDLLREKRAQHILLLADNIDDELQSRLKAGEQITWRDIAVEIALRDAGQTEAGHGQVTLSTLHRSKGLEWEHVLMVGVSEGLLPLDARSDVSDEDAGYSHLEEERRLAYVGITRAKVACEFYHSDQYAFPGGSDDKIYPPSRFLAEMGYSCEPEMASTDHVTSNAASYNDITNVFKSVMGLS